MTNKQIAERFATTNKDGHVNSMFIQDGTIFSYGYHFPIARKTDKVDEQGRRIVLFTNRGYSMTTSAHKSCVHSALREAGYRIITCDVSRGTVTSEVIEGLTKEIEDLRGREARARKELSREAYHVQAEQLSEDVAMLQKVYQL